MELDTDNFSGMLECFQDAILAESVPQLDCVIPTSRGQGARCIACGRREGYRTDGALMPRQRVQELPRFQTPNVNVVGVQGARRYYVPGGLDGETRELGWFWSRERAEATVLYQVEGAH